MSTNLGATSPKLDAVRELRRKAGRLEQGRYAVEGGTLLAEALAAGRPIEAVYVTEKAAAELPADLREAVAGRTFVISDRAMARLSDLETPPGILAVLPTELEACGAVLDGEPALLLAGIADPGNAGTLVRSAEIFGIARAVFAGDAVEPHNPKVVRAAMGALFRMRIAVASAHDVLAAARLAGYTVVAAAREGAPLPSFAFPERALIAIGNERHGVAAVLPSWDQTVSVPQAGRGESLNAAVAGGIILYAFSQRVRGYNPQS